MVGLERLKFTLGVNEKHKICDKYTQEIAVLENFVIKHKKQD